MNKKILFSIISFVFYLTLSFPVHAIETNTIRIGIKEDTYAESGYPGVSPWNNRNLYLGYDLLYGKMKTRPYLKYNLSNLITNNITPEKIIEAKLKVYQYSSSRSNSYNTNIYQIKSNWNHHDLNWYNQPATEFYKTYTLSAANGWKVMNITDLIKEQINPANSNYGLNLKFENENSNGVIFWSNACSSTPSPPSCSSGQEPHILLTYQTNEPPTKPTLNKPANNLQTAKKAIDFTWNPSSDPNGDKIYYQIQIAVDPTFSNVILESTWSENISYNHNFTSDGIYYWRIKAKDPYITESAFPTSDIRSVEIDSSAPAIPEIIPETPFTYGSDNTIQWDFDEGSERYKVKFIAQRYEKNSKDEKINIIEIETEDLGYKWNKLAEKEYFYKVKAIDFLKNTSDWSEETSSIQDFTKPIVNNLKTDNLYISPQQSKNIKDKANITFYIADLSLKNWQLIFENENREIVHAIQGEKNKGNLTWYPTNLDDGYYFIYLKVIDQVGLLGKSNIISINIDNTSPEKPKFLSPKNKSLTNSLEILIQAKTVANTTHNLFINNKKITTWYSSRFQKGFRKKYFKEGKNKIKIISEDQAGNSSMKETTIKTDWTAPKAPKITLHPNKSKKQIKLKIHSNSFKKAYIYNPAGLHKKTTKKNITVIKNWTGETTYTFYVRIEDKAGNLSKRSKKVTYKTPGKKKEKKKSIDWSKFPELPRRSKCKYKYQIAKNKLTTINCNLSTPKISSLNHSTSDKKNYRINSIGSYNPYTTLIIKKYTCKKRSFWDPRTWFGCHEIYVGTNKKQIKMQNLMYSKIGKTKRRTSIYSNYERNNKPVGYEAKFDFNKNYHRRLFKAQNKVFFQYKIGSKWLDFVDYTNYSNSIKIPKYKYNSIKDKTNKPFRFPFNRIIGVTQWHGKTDYDNNHTGIDFYAYKEPIYAMADGYIYKAGWNGNKKSCNNGGRILIIAHDNGLYTAYAHLADYKKKNGKKWKAGQKVKRGNRIGTTGNSGAHNCKNLGYHLHLEVRKKAKWGTDINPVPKIDINWKKVKTINHKTYPGRLSGANPHPKY